MYTINEEIRFYRDKYGDEYREGEDTLHTKIGGKTWSTPRYVKFEKIHAHKTYEYGVVGFREPRVGEHYLSGVITEAYLAYNDLNTKYLIVKRGGDD